MLMFAFRRMLASIPVLIGITLILFIMLNVVPGDPIALMMKEHASPEVIARVREQMHLDDPLVSRYLSFLWNAVQGDLGNSIKLNRPVTDLILKAFPNTLVLAVSAALVSWVVGIPAGILSAVRRDSFVDRFFMGFSLLGVSMPIFWSALVGIPEPEARLDAYPHQLSGGLRQRAMIAMGLICEPKLLIADEPTTALDVTTQAQILRLMRELRDRVGTSIILITHDLGIIAEMCEEVNVMYAGQIVEQADVFDLFERPSHPYTRGLLASIPRATEPRMGRKMPSIPGMVPNLARLPPGCRFNPRCGEALPVCRQQAPDMASIGDAHVARCWLHAGPDALPPGDRT
ncbi:oligopeptide/dipeptide ABC transporter ATP-binding protein [Rhodobacter ferrooxidans]|uniref:Oligopeptide/dipeptide ABC transporter, ATPase subunit n=1 Tax=Rhodobacter ferrooxidans TaxID=371731 RepID=C8S552_9RHOB|nr:oligopeptide/dipeptide ABC transporter ATP-binding protein [Rhodobacter sp. SW2]EEW23917.1 oligopeptide/dipeptide ABC transporter, ATPase subunit [Rhodobacter sp. SW2]